MTIDRIDFASILASRLCHDLLGPIGGFANGLELLVEEQDANMRARYLEMLVQGSLASTNKLKFFRMAFGLMSGFGDTVETAKVRSAIEGIAHDRRPIVLGWMFDDEVLPGPVAKIILNLALILVDSLVVGGELDIGYERGADVLEIVLHAKAKRIFLDKDVKRVLVRGAEAGDMTSRTSPAVLVQAIAAQSGGQVRLSHETPASLLVGVVLNVSG